MPTIKYAVTLTDEERQSLQVIITKGAHRSRKVVDALILLNCDKNQAGPRKSEDEIADFLQTGKLRVGRVKKRFVENGLEAVLQPAHGGGQKKRIDGDFEAHLVALSCAQAPKGRARWSLRLLADKMVELDYIDAVSHETIRATLKKTNLNLGKRNSG